MTAFLLSLIFAQCNVVTLPHEVHVVASGGGHRFDLEQVRSGRTGMLFIRFTFVEDGSDRGFIMGVTRLYMHGNKVAVYGRFRKEGKWYEGVFRTDGSRIHLAPYQGGFLSERVE